MLSKQWVVKLYSLFVFSLGKKKLIKPFKSLENLKGKTNLYSSNILTLETQLNIYFLTTFTFIK